MSFPKTVNQMGSFAQIRKNSLFRFCRPILDIFGFTLLQSSERYPPSYSADCFEILDSAPTKFQLKLSYAYKLVKA